MTDKDQKTAWKTLTEEIEVAGHQLIEKITALVAEGNVRKLRVRSKNDDIVLEIPLTAGAVAGGVVAIAAPFLAVLGAIAGLLAKVRIEVVRDVDENGNPPKTDITD